MLPFDCSSERIEKADSRPAKSRLIPVRLISMAMTGFFYTFTRPRTSTPMSMLKYDPVGMSEILRIFSPTLSKP